MISARPAVGSIVAALAMVIAVQFIWWTGQDAIVFADGDSYLRMIRVERLVETGDWFDVVIPRANAPYGFDSHWTRPLDVMMVLLAAPVAPVLGWHDAILFAGEWISPLLHVVTVLVMVWALVPLLGRVGACIAGGLTATQIGFLSFSVVGRADHHLLFAVLIVAVIGFMLRAYEQESATDASRAGLALAAGVWVGPEFLLLTAIVVTVTGFRWLVGRPLAVELNRALSIGLAVGLAATLLIERGGGVLEIEYDRLSLFHVAVGGMIAGFWAVVQGVETKRRLGGLARVLVSVAGAAVMAAVVVLVFPAALGYPFVEVDPDFLHVQRFIKDYEGIASLRDVLLFLGPVLFALPWAACRLFGTTQRWTWCLLMVCLLVFTALSAGWLRWSLYPTVLAIIALADLLMATDTAISARVGFPHRTLLKVPLILFLVVGPMGVAMALKPGEADDGIACPVTELAGWLQNVPGPVTIAAPANFGPEILYRTEHRVLSTLSHRNSAGVLDAYRLMIDDDPAGWQRIIRDRGVDMIVGCPDSGAESYIRARLTPGSLYTRLLEGDVPGGMEEMTLPNSLAEHFRAFRINPGVVTGDGT